MMLSAAFLVSSAFLTEARTPVTTISSRVATEAVL